MVLYNSIVFAVTSKIILNFIDMSLPFFFLMRLAEVLSVLSCERTSFKFH